MVFMHMHVESHFQASDTVRDIVIGMADGLTVPFALAAGLTGTAAATSKPGGVGGHADMAAGLPVPSALAAGLPGTAAATSKLVVIAGLAEIAAGSIAMGLGGYL